MMMKSSVLKKTNPPTYKSSKEVRPRIECNDPDLVDLEIGTYDCQLSELMILEVYIAKEDLEKLFHGVSQNRSIKNEIWWLHG